MDAADGPASYHRINAACNILGTGCYQSMTGAHKPVERIMAFAAAFIAMERPLTPRDS